MATSKKTAKAAKKSKSKATKSTKTSLARGIDTGPLPPYGTAIREAMARGNSREMKNVAASARKWIADAQAALDQLEGSLKK